MAGAYGGAKEADSKVKANHTDVYDIKFRGSEQAIVDVVGDGDTDLDLYIYDENGNLVANDTDNTDDCVCRWTPKWNDAFKIKKTTGEACIIYITLKQTDNDFHLLG